MFHIATTSNTVGSAITTFSKTTITLPHGFSVGETNTKHAELYNKNTPEKINITDMGKNNSASREFKHALLKIRDNPETNNINNYTKEIDNMKVYTISYDVSNGTNYRSFVYAKNHTYCIDMVGFADENRANEILDFIVKTIEPDYKQGRD